MSIDQFGIQVLQEIDDALSVLWWVDFGTCLGAVRDSDFISWDRDIDISAFYDPIQSPICMVRLRSIEAAKVSGHYRKDGAVAGAHLTIQDVRIGVHFWNPGSDEYVYEASDHELRIPKRFFENFETGDIRGTPVQVPSPPESYLEFIYGPNWRTPNEKWLNSPEHIEARKRWMH